MGLLSLAVLGGLDVRHAGRPITFKTRKTAALLIYLAVESGLHTRERLAALLWPESAEARARASLRRAVSDLQGCLRHAVSGEHSPHITADQQRIGLIASSDLE